MIETACACTKVRRAARALTQLYDEAVAPAGLRITQFSLLRTLQRVGDTHISGLAAATGLERSTLGRNVRLLEKAGLVQLFGSGDARERKVVLSGKGRAAIEAAMPLWQQAQDRLGADLGEETREALFALLDSLCAAANAKAGRTAQDGDG